MYFYRYLLPFTQMQDEFLLPLIILACHFNQKLYVLSSFLAQTSLIKSSIIFTLTLISSEKQLYFLYSLTSINVSSTVGLLILHINYFGSASVLYHFCMSFRCNLASVIPVQIERYSKKTTPGLHFCDNFCTKECLHLSLRKLHNAHVQTFKG